MSAMHGEGQMSGHKKTRSRSLGLLVFSVTTPRTYHDTQKPLSVGVRQVAVPFSATVFERRQIR